jgi:hypothetical protein
MDSLITFFITLTSFLLGYFIGRGEKINAPLLAETIRKKLKMSKLKPGPLMRPTVKQIDRRQNKELYEGMDETAKAFKEMGVDNV